MKARQCPQCGHLVLRGFQRCAECGWGYDDTGAERRRLVENVSEQCVVVSVSMLYFAMVGAFMPLLAGVLEVLLASGAFGPTTRVGRAVYAVSSCIWITGTLGAVVSMRRATGHGQSLIAYGAVALTVLCDVIALWSTTLVDATALGQCGVAFALLGLLACVLWGLYAYDVVSRTWSLARWVDSWLVILVIGGIAVLLLIVLDYVGESGARPSARISMTAQLGRLAASVVMLRIVVGLVVDLTSRCSDDMS